MIRPRRLKGSIRRARRVVVKGIENAFGMVRPMSRRALVREDLPAPVTDVLFSRLGNDDFEALSAKLSAEDRAYWMQQERGSVAWKRAAVHYSVHYGSNGSAGPANLVRAAPPAGVHAMSRGSRAAGGSIYHADLIFGALKLARADLPPGGRILDFGCSSGRVIRVVKAYRPDLDCHGCDPNEAAIRWATDNLPDISFAVSPLHPPLSHASSSFDCVFGISVWSHFGHAAASSWLIEINRLLKPGGVLILTTHSFGSVAYFTSKGLRAIEDMRTVLSSMLVSGFGFLGVFGKSGDWGIVDPDWGEAYISPEWLLNSVTPQWEVLLYRTSANEDNQDLAILRKRDVAAVE
ncbi:MAG: class I SAM-dependent methyltransferase [Chloroflexi bacterium]|nr:MAG: class I SAM-dependent methyltransferase [Chloroflexota bacterium]